MKYPRFYNTLQAIGNSAAMLVGANNQVTEMVYALGTLMRISLSGEKYLVPLAEELEHVELYMKLLDFRYHGRIHMSIDIPKEMLQEKIPKLTLQPLIENAVQHGFEDKRIKGQITICGECNGNQRRIYVTDTGKGIEESDMNRLQEHLKNSATKMNAHVGLSNVNQRLKLLYGEESGLLLTRPEEGGCCVIICYDTLHGEDDIS